jgi:hypothetical protein
VSKGVGETNKKRPRNNKGEICEGKKLNKVK